MQPVDFHTHRGDPSDASAAVSVGIHPWDSATVAADAVGRLRAEAAGERVVAIGECGLDALRGAPMPRQLELLRAQAAVAEELHKPLILHIVRAWNEIIALKRELRPSVPWAIHGFRGKPELAQRLLDEGFYLSLGPRHNPLTASLIPSGRLLIESDDDPGASIGALAASLPAYDPSVTLRFLGLPPGAGAPAAVINRRFR